MSDAGLLAEAHAALVAAAQRRELAANEGLREKRLEAKHAHAARVIVGAELYRMQADLEKLANEAEQSDAGAQANTRRVEAEMHLAKLIAEHADESSAKAAVQDEARVGCATPVAPERFAPGATHHSDSSFVDRPAPHCAAAQRSTGAAHYVAYANHLLPRRRCCSCRPTETCFRQTFCWRQLAQPTALAMPRWSRRSPARSHAQRLRWRGRPRRRRRSFYVHRRR